MCNCGLVGDTSVQTIAKPRDNIRELIKKADITLPDAIRCKNATVVTQKTCLRNTNV